MDSLMRKVDRTDTSKEQMRSIIRNPPFSALSASLSVRMRISTIRCWFYSLIQVDFFPAHKKMMFRKQVLPRAVHIGMELLGTSHAGWFTSLFR